MGQALAIDKLLTPAQQLTGLQNYILSRRALCAGQARYSP